MAQIYNRCFYPGYFLQAFLRFALGQRRWGSCWFIRDTAEYITLGFVASYLELILEAQSCLAGMTFVLFFYENNGWNFQVVNARSYVAVLNTCCFIQWRFDAWSASLRTSCSQCEVFVTYAGIWNVLYKVFMLVLFTTVVDGSVEFIGKSGQFGQLDEKLQQCKTWTPSRKLWFRWTFAFGTWAFRAL